MTKQITLTLLFALIISPISTLAQTPTGQRPAEEKVVVGTNEVMLDAVVRDKKGRPVKDLKVSDFQVFEEGIAQDIKSFRLVAADADSVADTVTKPTSSKAPGRVIDDFNSGRLGAVALIFDRLTVESRKRAHDAALSYVGAGFAGNDFVGVFGIDQTLSVLQTFTSDGQLVKQAIDRAGVTSSTVPSVTTSQVANLATQNLNAREQISRAGLDVNTPGWVSLDATLAEMSLRAAQEFERLEETQKGQATTDGLLSVISAMGKLPGRKAVIFFSEGVAIPVAVASNFRAVISNANRANVSIYAVDAAGLRVKSSDAEAGSLLSTLGQTRAAQAASSSDAFGSMMKDLERNEALIRKSPESGLGQLAEQTGGMLVNATNNPGERLRQVNEDLHSYYVLTYSSKNQNYDGRFRQINVKVNRSGTDIQARKGYYALATTYDSPVMAFEAPALAILAGKTQPTALATKAAAFSFPNDNGSGLVSVIVDAPLSAISFVGDPEKKTYRTDFSVVVLITDGSQRVLRKLSGQYVLTGQLAGLDQAKQGNVLFYRETELDPGQYTVESIVYDAAKNQSGVTHGSLLVGEADTAKLRVSSLVVAGRVEKLQPADQQAPNPFKVGEVLLYPNMGEALHKIGGRGLILLLTVYPAKGSSTTPRMSIEFDQGGKSLGQLPVELPAPDKNGRIQYTGTIPLDAFPAGEYGLIATVTDGASTTIRTGHFTVQP